MSLRVHSDRPYRQSIRVRVHSPAGALFAGTRRRDPPTLGSRNTTVRFELRGTFTVHWGALTAAWDGYRSCVVVLLVRLDEGMRRAFSSSHHRRWWASRVRADDQGSILTNLPREESATPRGTTKAAEKHGGGQHVNKPTKRGERDSARDDDGCKRHGARPSTRPQQISMGAPME